MAHSDKDPLFYTAALFRSFRFFVLTVKVDTTNVLENRKELIPGLELKLCSKHPDLG